MWLEKLKQEIDQQVVELNACRQAARYSLQEVKKTLTNPTVLCWGLMTGFLIGYFSISKKQASINVEKNSSLTSNIAALFSSPLFLFAVTLLKNELTTHSPVGVIANEVKQ